MPEHEARAQMLGYLYQARYALELLLNSDDSSAFVSIEKFDDIAFENKGSPQEFFHIVLLLLRTCQGREKC